MSRVLSVAPVLAPHAHPQAEITGAIAPLLAPDPQRRALLERLHAAAGVDQRHLILPLDAYPLDFAAASVAFRQHGTELGAQAVAKALAQCGLEPPDVDFLLFTSVTGVAAPSLDVLVAQQLGMREDVRRMPSFGLGCAAGAAGLGRVRDHLLGHPHDVAVLLTVELCSLTFQRDVSTANLVASGLFGDGAAAAVVVGEQHPLAGSAGPRLVDSSSRLYPGTTDALGWRVGNGGFQILLSPDLPDLLRRNLAEDVGGLLTRHRLEAQDVTTWLMHPGGPRILAAVGAALDLPEPALAPSRRLLSQAGNLSSAAVLLLLAEQFHQPQRSWGVLAAFGPGIGVDLVLLSWG